MAQRRRIMACFECGHRAEDTACTRTPEGLACPSCHEPGGMTAILASTVYSRSALDVFEMDTNRWFWAVNGQYPTGPFDTREDAAEDAELSVQFELDEPPSDIDAEWKADQPFRDAAYETVRRGFEGALSKTARTR